MVIRNAGGRVSPDVLADLAYIGYLSGTLNPAGPRFEVAVIHHTQCGTHFLADADFRHGFAELIISGTASPSSSRVTTLPSPRKPSCTPSRPSGWTSTDCGPAPSCRRRSPSPATSTTSTPA
jgi:carbonic anhydrase